MRYLPHVLTALLLLVQVELWVGKGSLRHVMALQSQLDAQRAANSEAAAANARVEAELVDLAEGLEMVEEHARTDLGMLEPDEILVLVQPAGATAAASGAAGAASPPAAPSAPR